MWSQPGIRRSPVEMEYGWIEEFKLPEFLKSSYEYDNSRKVTVCMAPLKSEPFLLYEHLKLLSNSRVVEPPSLLVKKSLARWQEIDIANMQMRNWFYLSTLQSEKKEPLDHKKIVDLVETFLLMVIRFGLAKPEKKEDKKAASKVIRNKKVNPDEILVKNFIMDQRRIAPNISRSTMVARIQVAVATKKIQLSREYAPSTYKKWDKQADSIKDMQKKLSRPKSKNLH